MPGALAWREIREKRNDLSDYVIHFTSPISNPTILAEGVLRQILRDKHIMPSFSPMSNRHSKGIKHNTVKGPDPVVCFTEMPLWAVIQTRKVFPGTMGFGIAYHKRCLYEAGGRPVIYGDQSLVGTEIKPGEPGYIPNRVIYAGGVLPPSHQYLWAMFDPHDPGSRMPNVDFTWEREWRIKVRKPGLPVILFEDKARIPRGMILVETDFHRGRFIEELDELDRQDQNVYDWAKWIRVVSLELAEHQIKAGNVAYARLETWPEKRTQ
ncbi:hypothetical protein AYO44_12365 [Planctomycetaceae bacterium SCGC AG-212-F19]|nr:hypothetical protein AYO44_12365 [Planctomycetaceae bacterium SCGC AG-212-F19]